MASGKKNYFRHSFVAHKDIKLLQLRDKIGIGFYFYYFTLLEICGEESSDEPKTEFEFHDSVIRNLWCVNLKKSERIANEMHTVGLLEFKKREKSFWFSIPKILKYLGKYQTKITPNGSNKRKGKEIKENKSKGKESINTEKKLPTHLDAVIQLWNKIHTNKPYEMFSLPSLKLQEFSKMNKIVENWEDYFEKAKNAFDDKWRPDLLWCIDENRYYEIMAGRSYGKQKEELPNYNIQIDEEF